MVRHFDFEEAEQSPFEMPINFYRYGGDDGAAARGFPPFGSMRLTNKVAYSGNWSFEFALDGGSLAARVPTAVLPAVPLADYAVTTRVRTQGLNRSRARLVAWLHDKQGNIIEQSRVASSLIMTHGEWEAHTIEVRGEYEHAADLVIELQLLQPRQFATSNGGDALLLDDVGARAWFDDVTVWHLPRIEISTAHPGNVMTVNGETQTPSLEVLVRDLAHADLFARLRIFDVRGDVVHDERFAAPRSPRARQVLLPMLPYGWYRAVLDLTDAADADQLVARRWVDFALLAPRRGTNVQPDARFGVVLHDDWARHTRDVNEIVERLGAGSVVLPIWPTTAEPVTSPQRLEQVRELIQRMSARRLQLTMAMDALPRQLASTLDIAREDVLAAFARQTADNHHWRSAVEPIILLGGELHYWQLGSAQMAMTFDHAALQPVIDAATKSVRQFVSSPTIVVPFGAHNRVNSDQRFESRVITLPYEVRPEAVAEFTEQWNANRSPYTLRFRTVPVDAYSQHERMLDLFFRTLHAVRSGVNGLQIDAPWSLDEMGRREPDPAFVVWRQLADHLQGRRFVGEMDMGEAGHCWLFQGDSMSGDLLIAWSKRDDVDQLVMQLADDAIVVSDMYGNAQNVYLTGAAPGEHRLPLGRSPIFIEGVNLPLVQFRGSFSLEPAFVASEHRTHRHEIVLRNPWDQPLSGTLQLLDKPQWHISPRSHDFSIAAKDEVRLPLEIIFDRSVIAGETTLDAHVRLQANGNYRLLLSTPVRVGLSHLDFSMAWRVITNAETGRDDLVITQYITNSAPAGSEPVFADAMLRAPHVRQERRLIAGLEPGQITIRMFHIPDGVAILSGQTVRLSLSDRNGPGMLNRELHIPALTAAQQTASVSDDR